MTFARSLKPEDIELRSLPQHLYHKQSPYYEVVKKRFTEWLTCLSTFSDHIITQTLETDFPLAASLVFSQASEDMLFYISKYYFLFTFTDDCIEKNLSAECLPDHVMSFLRLGYATDHIFSLIHKEVREEMKLSKKQTEIITLCYEKYFESASALHNTIESQGTLTLDKYYEYRKWDIEVAQDLALHDCITGTNLTTEIWDDKILADLMSVYCESVWITNDYSSFMKDYKYKNNINFIMLLTKQDKITLQEAIDKCYKLVLNSRNKLEFVCKKLLDAYPFITQFIDSVKHGAYGYCEFQLRSARYTRNIDID